MLEMALGMPLVLTLGGYGAELSNYAIVNQRVNQAALQLADNGSRVGANNGLATFQLRELDLNDVLQGTRLAGKGIKLTTNGRITISSLEYVQQSYDSVPVQRIHWQRCIGARGGSGDAGYDSSYGTAPTSAGSTATQANAGTATPNGMGDAGAMVNAPSGAGVIFVEVNYQYQPLFGTLFMTARKIHYIASFIVRDKRDFAQIYNPSPAATAATCDLHAA